MSVVYCGVCVTVVLLAASLVSAIPLSQSGNGQKNTISTGLPPLYTGSAATCTQVEIDLFNIGPTGQPLHDLFQYIQTAGAGGVANQGINFGQPGTVYDIVLPVPIFTGGVTRRTSRSGEVEE